MEPQIRNHQKHAPGWPGDKPRWTSSAKCGVGTSLQATSRVWFTLGEGIVNEVYYPEVDQACLRDLGFIVTDGRDFFSEEKNDTRQRVEWMAEGVPAYRLTNEHERYRIEKEILTDPRLNVLLQRTRFVQLDRENNLRLYLLLAPRLCNGGANNTAWFDAVAGQQVLFASRNNAALALACSAPFRGCSAGFVGVSDGWQDLSKHKRLTCQYGRAENGNVALVAEIDLAACSGRFAVALGFDSDPLGAAHQARASLLDGFDAACNEYVSAWQKWERDLHAISSRQHVPPLYRISAAMLRTHQAKNFPGGSDASLSIPWGASRGDEDRGGYHLAWPRDLVEISGGLLAVGKTAAAERVLRYLAITQQDDGSWPQNMWVNGKQNWPGKQMDEAGLPVLLAARAVRQKLIQEDEFPWVRSMVTRALHFIVSHGPATEQDRWENTAGYSPYTIAVEIAALIEGASVIEQSDREVAEYLRETADAWNESIERWCYVTNTKLANEVGVPGYYLRITPVASDGNPAREGLISVADENGERRIPAKEIVSPDALALVRFGLRVPDDPRIVNTVRAIDALLKTETSHGPCWHRYNHDGYGEHHDGRAFDGHGIGRAWPLLTGERAHYELAAGNRSQAQRLLAAMESFSGDGGLLPEQIWDSTDIPERRLFLGRPSGSAMPLAWAHAEYLKLCRSLADGEINDMPVATRQRYIVDRVESAFFIWRFADQIASIPRRQNLRIEVREPARVWLKIDTSEQCIETKDSKLGIHFADLSVNDFGSANEIIFTFHWHNTAKWEGRDFRIIRK